MSRPIRNYGKLNPKTAGTGNCCPIVELRQYTLHPGQRDVLIELFDANLSKRQEAEGIKVIGIFRRMDAPDQFVWLRGFPRYGQPRPFFTGFLRRTGLESQSRRCQCHHDRLGQCTAAAPGQPSQRLFAG